MSDELREIYKEDKEYPPALKEIPKPPEKLYLKGALPDPNEFTYISVVGSRKYSHYGREVCEKLITGLTGQPIVIVSGLAIGIDCLAHKQALASNLRTIAIPGSGLSPKVLYPRSNVKLAQDILSAGGALLSEFEPDMSATPYTFPQRNRIMAGISQATLVIESTEKSGTLITARLATDYNRDVLAVPGSIFSGSSVGTNRLIRLGATPVTSSDEVLEALGFDLDTKEAPADISKTLSKEEKQIYDLLCYEPISRDEIIIKTKLESSTINMLLSTMEVKGIIKETGGLFIIT